jgi:hypothetical protein
MSEDEARRKEREQNQIPQGPRWLWDWRWWLGIIVTGSIAYLIAKANGN